MSTNFQDAVLDSFQCENAVEISDVIIILFVIMAVLCVPHNATLLTFYCFDIMTQSIYSQEGIGHLLSAELFTALSL